MWLPQTQHFQRQRKYDVSIVTKEINKSNLLGIKTYLALCHQSSDTSDSFPYCQGSSWEPKISFNLQTLKLCANDNIDIYKAITDYVLLLPICTCECLSRLRCIQWDFPELWVHIKRAPLICEYINISGKAERTVKTSHRHLKAVSERAAL